MDNRLHSGYVLQDGKYKIIQTLGQGGFGITYLAEQMQLRRQVAIKELFLSNMNWRYQKGKTIGIDKADNQPAFQHQKGKFIAEAQRLAAVHNEHVVTVFDIFEENDTAYYVMEYLKGQDLTHKMNGKPLSEETVTGYLAQILDALDALHSQGIWHLDIKPNNIIVEDDGCIKLIDLGASKQLEGNNVSRTVAYTLGFAPVEQLQDAVDKFGPWTDFYALGATLYVLLTGKKPPIPTGVADKDDSSFAALHAASEKMQRLIRWMMQPDRTKRPQSVADIKAFINGKDSDEDTTIVAHSEKPDIQQLADAGDPDALYALYLQNHSIRTLRQAAYKGNADAQYQLGQHLLDLHNSDSVGKKVYRALKGKKTNKEKAKEWFEKAARQGHRGAKVVLRNWKLI